MKLFLDFETHGALPIRRGTDVYLDNATPLLLTYAIENQPVQAHDFIKDPVTPHEFASMLANPTIELYAHNAFFDRNVIAKLLNIRTDVTRWRCSMAQALSHGLPGGLDPLCTVLGVPIEDAKIKDGHRLILKFCCGKTVPDGKDPEWPLFIQYAINDITAMRACVQKMPNWNYLGEELRLYHVDQIINDRGFAVDTQLAAEAVKALKAQKERLDDATWIATCGSVSAATQRDALLLYLCEHQGCVLRDLRAPTIIEALEDESLEESTKALLRIRLEASKTSTSKFKRMLDSTGKGGRLRGTLQYSGAARTARWAGRVFQPQNLPRPTMKLADIRLAIQSIREGRPDIATLFAPIGQACSNSLRGLIVAPEGKTLNVSDYSAIEGRVNAWLAGEDWKVTAFRNKEELYCIIYEKAFNLPPGTVTKKDPRRQIGKVLELALGYGGGVGAFLNMAAVYNLDLEELGRTIEPFDKSLEAWERAIEDGTTYGLSKEVYCACDTLKIGYRKANPNITQSWYQYEAAARDVINRRDKDYKVHVGPLTFDCNATWMRIRLPSGRFLCYALPKIMRDGTITYMSWRNKKWVRTKTYGGKLCENIVQAIARDLLGYALLLLHDRGYETVLHIHDEIVAEVPKGSNLDEFVKVMTTKPRWAAGLPLTAEGFASERYEKR